MTLGGMQTGNQKMGPKTACPCKQGWTPMPVPRGTWHARVHAGRDSMASSRPGRRDTSWGKDTYRQSRGSSSRQISGSRGFTQGRPGRRQQQRFTGPSTEDSPAAPAAPARDYKYTFYATCHPGLEQVVADELTALGIKDVKPGRAGVTFWSDHLGDGYRANLWLRSAIRVLLKLADGPLSMQQDGYKALYDYVRSCGVRWADLILPGCSISIEPRLWSCTNINSSKLVWQAIKDAVSDHVYDARGERLQPPLDAAPASVPLYVTAYQDYITIYRDMSGTSLHRRGYRANMHRSPLNEAAAAGVLMLAGWHRLCADGRDAVLVDPMCGSGTLLIEAAMIASNTAPGLSRALRKDSSHSYPFTSWPDADQKAWLQAVQEAQQALRKAADVHVRLYGNDVHEGALALAMQDIRQAGFTQCARLHKGDCATWELPEVPDLVATNPPWGVRLLGSSQGRAAGQQSGDDHDAGPGVGLEPQASEELITCWQALSDFLRGQCPDTDAIILSGNKDAVNPLRMKPHKKWPLVVGGVDVTAYMYHVLPPKNKDMQTASTAAAV